MCIWVDVNSSNKMLMIIKRLGSSHHLRLSLRHQRRSAESTCSSLAGFLLSVSSENIPPVEHNGLMWDVVVETGLCPTVSGFSLSGQPESNSVYLIFLHKTLARSSLKSKLG